MSTSKQKRLAREYAEKHGVKYTDALRAISESPARIPLWDGEQAQGVLTYRLGADLDTVAPYDLHLGGGSPHVLIAGASGSGGESVWEMVAAQVLTKPMPWDPTLTGNIVLIDSKGHNARRWEGRPGVEAVTDRESLNDMEIFRLLMRAQGGPDEGVVGDPQTLEQANTLIEAERTVEALDQALNEAWRRTEIIAKNNENHWLNLPAPVLAEERLAPLIVILPALSYEGVMLARVQSRATELAQMGRVAGVHLIVVTNRVTTAMLPPTLRGSLPIRIVMGRVPTTMERIMFGGSDVEPGEDVTHGPARFARIMNSIDTYDSTPHRVQVTRVHEETLDKWLPRSNGHNAHIGTNDPNG